MARSYKRIGKKELNDLKRIEDLLESTKQPTQKEQLVDKAKQIQHKRKENILTNASKFDTVKMTKHAFQRAEERFHMNKDTALPYFRSVLKSAKEIGVQTANNGGEAILFAKDRIGIYVSTDYKEIRTVIKRDTITYEPIKAKVAELHAKEIRKITRKEYTCKKRLQDEIYEINVKKAELELRKHKSRSKSVKMACQANINALNIYIKEKEDEINQIRNIKKQIEKSMISVI